jgi:hypothetical protein
MDQNEENYQNESFKRFAFDKDMDIEENIIIEASKGKCITFTSNFQFNIKLNFVSEKNIHFHLVKNMIRKKKNQ